MPFVKVVKNSAYFSRYQVKYRRRREGKTDYQSRPHIEGDRVACVAYAHELPHYGLPVGLTNYASSYAVGLLLARRVLAKFGLSGLYEGKAAYSEDYTVEAKEDEHRPLKVFMDIGLRRASTGAKIFSVMKGVCDGGVYVPHSGHRFVGFSAEEKKLQGDVLREHIFGGHVAAYMKSLQEEDSEAYKQRFSRFIAVGLEADNIEAVYESVHQKIRKNPAPRQTGNKGKKVEHKRYHQVKLTREERKKRVEEKKVALKEQAEAEAEENEGEVVEADDDE